MMLSGCGSYMRVKTYRLRSSYATWNSVLNEGSESTCGANWRKAEIFVAPCQVASSPCPSITGARRVRTAIAVIDAVRGSGPRPEASTAEEVACCGGIASSRTPNESDGSDIAESNFVKSRIGHWYQSEGWDEP